MERGYLLLPLVFQQDGGGELDAAAATTGEAAAIGERFDPVFALAGHERGHLLIRLGRLGEGLALLDEGWSPSPPASYLPSRRGSSPRRCA